MHSNQVTLVLASTTAYYSLFSLEFTYWAGLVWWSLIEMVGPSQTAVVQIADVPQVQLQPPDLT